MLDLSALSDQARSMLALSDQPLRQHQAYQGLPGHQAHHRFRQYQGLLVGQVQQNPHRQVLSVPLVRYRPQDQALPNLHRRPLGYQGHLAGRYHQSHQEDQAQQNLRHRLLAYLGHLAPLCHRQLRQHQGHPADQAPLNRHPSTQSHPESPGRPGHPGRRSHQGGQEPSRSDPSGLPVHPVQSHPELQAHPGFLGLPGFPGFRQSLSVLSGR